MNVVNIIYDELNTLKRNKQLLNEIVKTKIKCRFWPGVFIEQPYTYVGITRSHKRIVKWAKDNNKKEVLLAEDDFCFPSELGFEYFIEHKPKHYDIYLAGVYVGVNDLRDSKTVCCGGVSYCNQKTFKLKQFSGLHFYFVHSRFYDTFLHIDESQSLDNNLSALAKLRQCEIFSLYPMAAIQYENVSSTSGCVFRHDQFFQPGDVYGL